MTPSKVDTRIGTLEFFDGMPTTAMVIKMIGKGAQYAYATTDVDGDSLAGSQTYRLRLPPNVPPRISGRLSSTAHRFAPNFRPDRSFRARTTSVTGWS